MVNSLNKEAKNRIVEAIRDAEDMTSGEIRVHVKAKTFGDAMKEARKTFRRLRMDRTRERNGVLIFVAWKSRQFAIVGDEGIHKQVGPEFWDRTRDMMAHHFSDDDLPGGIVAGVLSVGKKLREYFPAKSRDKNELSDSVSEGK